ncbi:MAG: RNB domain-containing ribonuclease, partial [Pirellulaceae bacterium]
RDGEADALPDDLTPATIHNLYAAFACLEKARRRRGTMELDLPEYKVTINDGKVTDIGLRTRLDSHRLIEEFMIAANVAAAEALEAKHAPCMYRVHPPPDAAKLEALRDFLDTFGLSLPRGQVTRAGQFADILSRAAAGPSADVIHEAILRAQSQAAYGPRNFGHFGLALRRYAHFTSPIRRYADLMVHRSLIAAWQLGPGGTGRDTEIDFDETGLHISTTERKAQAAEREAVDRYMALYLSERTGMRMKGRITGVTRFGLFVRLKGLGADGLVPMGLLGDERFHHDEGRHCIEGQASGRIFSLGDEVEVDIREASPLTGGLVLAITRHWPLARSSTTGKRTQRRQNRRRPAVAAGHHGKRRQKR